MAKTVYPKLFEDIDLTKEAKIYYRGLYGIDLTDEQVKSMYEPKANRADGFLRLPAAGNRPVTRPRVSSLFTSRWLAWGLQPRAFGRRSLQGPAWRLPAAAFLWPSLTFLRR